MNKIITDVEMKKFELTYDEFSQKSAAKNELLINELIHVLKNDEKYRDRDSIEDSIELKMLHEVLSQVYETLEIDSVYEIKDKVEELKRRSDYLQNVVEIKNEHLEKKNVLIAKLKNREKKAKATATAKSKEAKKYKKLYMAQKNRKVVKVIDKLAGK